MEKILITGHNGFLGQVMESSLTQKGMRVIGLQSKSGQRVDIRSPFDLYDQEFDIIIHSAGKAHSIPRSNDEIKAFYDVNLGGTKNLCSAIDSLIHKPKAFIFISTVSVYGLDRGEGITEEYPPLGTNPYSESKILAEAFLREWANKNNITLGILRLPLVAGPTPPGNLGAMIKGIRSGRYLSIGKADARKSIVWAEDIANIIPRLSEVGGTFNLTDGYHPSFKELEHEICSVLVKPDPKRIPLSIAKIVAKFGDLLGDYSPINSEKLSKITSTLVFDDSLARQQLGWDPSSILKKIKEIV